MKKNSRLAVLSMVLIFIGIGINLYLTSHHYSLLYGLSDKKSFCSVNSKIDCDAVNTSKFSELFGIPVALFASFAFLVEFILLVGYKAFGEDEKPRIARYFFYLCCCNLVATIILGVASSVVLKTYCLMCMTIWFLSFLLFASSYFLAADKKMSLLVEDIRSLFRSGTENGSRGVLFVLFLVPLGSVIANGMWKQSISGDLDHVVESSISDWQNARKIDFFIEKSPQLGNPSAMMQIVEFSDFQCPHCRRAAPSLHAFVNSHRDDVHFVFQNYPLDTSCNKEMKSQVHDQACLFAKAVLCGDQQGKFVETHDWIFEHQEDLGATLIDSLVKQVPLNKTQFDTCLASPEIASQIAAQIERGKLAGVEGTPSIFVNGRLLPGGFIIPILEAAYKSLKSSRP